jgi:hypothetical protein
MVVSVDAFTIQNNPFLVRDRELNSANAQYREVEVKRAQKTLKENMQKDDEQAKEQIAQSKCEINLKENTERVQAVKDKKVEEASQNIFLKYKIKKIDLAALKQQPKCTVCEKTVYVTEQVLYENLSFHRSISYLYF